MTKRYCSQCGSIFEYEPNEPTNMRCPGCGKPWTGPEKMSLIELENAQRQYPQLRPWQIFALEQMSGNLSSIKFERRTDMKTRSAGMDTGPGKEKAPQVQKQLEALRSGIERLNQVTSNVTNVFRPVLAEEVGGEKTMAETPGILRDGLAPLAEALAELEDLIETEVKRLHSLVRRCEV